MDLNIPKYVTDACDLRDAEHHRGMELLTQLRTGRADAKPGAVAKIRRVTGTGTTPDLIVVDEITRLDHISIEEGTA